MKTPETNLYHAAMIVVELNDSYAADRKELYDMIEPAIKSLKQALTAYEQSIEQSSSRQQENDKMETKEEILSKCSLLELYQIELNCLVKSSEALEAMQLYSDQQTSSLKSEN